LAKLEGKRKLSTNSSIKISVLWSYTLVAWQLLRFLSWFRGDLADSASRGKDGFSYSDIAIMFGFIAKTV
jgi:hypothetical protein